MSSMTALPRSRPLTRADLATMPDDGHRYELIDGALIVSPAPVRLHQRVVMRLARVLDDACPPELEVLTAPFEVVLDEQTVLQPDLLVARDADFSSRDLPTAPLLAVEVLSPSTRRFDLLLKRSRLEAAGCPSYCVVDPHEDPDEARLIAWEPWRPLPPAARRVRSPLRARHSSVGSTRSRCPASPDCGRRSCRAPAGRRPAR